MKNENTEKSSAYSQAGVNIDNKMSALKAVKALVATTKTVNVVGGIGSFGGYFRWAAITVFR